ncbi:MAG: sodium:alanine symporter family protein [Ruminococcus sp.]|nr:sodium:alanine symporter family protein [Ruminococcus sp.]
MKEVLEQICGLVWGKALVFLLLGTGAVCTLRLGFVQLRLFSGLRGELRRGRGKNGGLSQLKTVCLSLGAAMGTGNITGVAAALAAGGPGAVFWMWVSAFFGMALVFAENELSVMFSEGGLRGPMAYLRKGLGSRALAGFFALSCTLAAFGMGGMVQVSAVRDAMPDLPERAAFPLAIAVFAGILFVISGGAERSGQAAQILLPAASLVYAVLCLAVILRFRERLPHVFGEILRCAFGPKQAAGGALGYTVSVGIRRGIFSNEAGLGSSPILHSAAESGRPGQQGFWSMFEVFFDTVLCCTLTAVTLLCAGEASPGRAFSLIIGAAGEPLICAETAVFAFCTVIGWHFCGETAFRYLFGERFAPAARVIFAAAAASGILISLETVWVLSDIFNALMAFPNLIGILLLSKRLKSE